MKTGRDWRGRLWSRYQVKSKKGKHRTDKTSLGGRGATTGGVLNVLEETPLCDIGLGD